MAKKSLIARETKRKKLTAQYAAKRKRLLTEMKEQTGLLEKLQTHKKIQKLPRDSSTTRLHNRCFVTGRPKGYFRFFGLSRHVIREMSYDCNLPGITKASW
uniref:Small ribosomal subunit protein uS14c n=1 Tax=prasinophyte sp. MBIC10622 TaxID=156113 RepID=A0A088CKG4_9CHLO|nr:ribosomal protein S14 [prasinophyte sp. MBIC10622]